MRRDSKGERKSHLDGAGQLLAEDRARANCAWHVRDNKEVKLARAE